MSQQRAVYLLVFDDFADWEPAYALAELRRSGKRIIRTVGFTQATVIPMGGLRITPDLELGLFSKADEALWFDMFKQGQLPEAAI
jgi:hypothetical protein